MIITTFLSVVIVAVAGVAAIAQQAVFVDLLASEGDGAVVRAYTLEGAPAGALIEVHSKAFDPVVVLLAPDGRLALFRNSQPSVGTMGARVGGASVTLPEGFGPDWIFAVAPSRPNGKGAFAIVSEDRLSLRTIAGESGREARRRTLLAIGGEARAARDMQAALNDLGFDAGVADGLVGPRTRAAIRAYQKARDFPQTGRLTAPQRDALLAERAPEARNQEQLVQKAITESLASMSRSATTGPADSPRPRAGTSDALASAPMKSGVAMAGPQPGASRVPRSAELPAMQPWVPPRPSDRGTVDRARLASALGDRPKTLGGVGDFLRSELATAGYSDAVYLRVPGGFAIMTRIEQIDSLGAPLPGVDRYSDAITWEATPFWELWEVFLALIKAPEGYFRTLTLIVTDRPFSPSGQAVGSATFENWWAEAVSALPVDVRAASFTDDHEVSVLVYRFTKTENDAPPEFVGDRGPPVKQQLRHLRLSELML